MKNLMFEMDMPGRNTWHFQYYPIQNISSGPRGISADPVPRWRVPDNMMNGYIPGDTGYRLSWGDAKFAKDSGEFTLSDPETGDEWITNKRRSLIFMNKFMQIGFMFKTHNVWGLGERVREFNLPKKAQFTGWARG